ncbi:hypothetical protein [Aquicoccus sp.]|uniref:hypothetical protein n=1 Tax=Aquicoccus sp. TaxID=2055851 RepID=UPI003566E7D5
MILITHDPGVVARIADKVTAALLLAHRLVARSWSRLRNWHTLSPISPIMAEARQPRDHAAMVRRHFRRHDKGILTE